MAILVTGGAGFIGSNFIENWFVLKDETIVNLDKLTYATRVSNPILQENNARYSFVKGDISDTRLVAELLEKYQIRAVIHFAAESHVDRSIDAPEVFIQTNIVGTFKLLEAVFSYWNNLKADARANFRFLHISTDEVYGSLEKTDAAFTEENRYAPNSPYSASKASSDHLVRSFHHTYGLPVLTTNCSNNYGPYQFPEKLIPLCIQKALTRQALPIYGDGQQIRDWLYVNDHCAAIRHVLEKGVVGEVYNIGGWNEKTNLSVVHAICEILDKEKPRDDAQSYSSQITFVRDRPGHDTRYAIDASKIERELNWRPSETFHSGLQKTVRWYLDHFNWLEQQST